MEHQDLYLRTATPGLHNSWGCVSHHRVWDANLFINKLKDEGFEVEVITEAEFLAKQPRKENAA